jgi:hypothetical protein
VTVVGIGMEETDGDRPNALFNKPPEPLFDLFVVERSDRTAGAIEPLGNLLAVRSGDQGLG